VGEHSVEHIELHGDPKIVKIFEEIQSSSLPTNESLGEKLVDELIGVDNSVGNDKRIGRSKRKIREMTFVDDFIRNQNILLKDYSGEFQEEISWLKKENKSSLRKDRRWYRQSKKLRMWNQSLKTRIEGLYPGMSELNVSAHVVIQVQYKTY